MSLVTSACLAVNYAPREVEQQLERPLPFDHERGQSFRRVPWDASGGTKGMSGEVYVAGFNFVNSTDLVAWLSRLPWSEAGDATLCVWAEGDDMSVYRFGGEHR